MRTNDNLIKFIGSFFRIFQANVEEINIDGKNISGIIVWEGEEGKQQFLWEAPENSDYYKEAIELIDFLIKYDLTTGDMVNITRESLKEMLNKHGWNLQRIDSLINFLCSVKIPMIDDGEISDYFLIHF